MAPASELTPRLRESFTTPPPRAIAVRGRSGAGKTTMLHAVARESGIEATWLSARDLVERMVAAIRADAFESFSVSLSDDPRPLVVEHLEDLRGKARTREEIQRLLTQRAEKGHLVVVTLTASQTQGNSEISDWLVRWTEVISLD
jgi:chromosomal replication initiation ATPase DnaA